METSASLPGAGSPSSCRSCWRRQRWCWKVGGDILQGVQVSPSFPPRGDPCLACLHDVNAHGRTLLTPSTRAHSHALRGVTPSMLARSQALLGLPVCCPSRCWLGFALAESKEEDIEERDMRDPMGAFRPRERKCEAKSVRRWCTFLSCNTLHRSTGCLYVQDRVKKGKGWKGLG